MSDGSAYFVVGGAAPAGATAINETTFHLTRDVNYRGCFIDEGVTLDGQGFNLGYNHLLNQGVLRNFTHRPSDDALATDEEVEEQIAGLGLVYTTPAQVTAAIAAALSDYQVPEGSLNEEHFAPGTQIPASIMDLSGIQTNMDSHWIDQALFKAVSGTILPGVSGPAGNKYNIFTFPNALATSAGALWMPPPHWLTYNLSLIWTGGANSGNAYLNAAAGQFGDGEEAAITYMGNFAVAAPNVVGKQKKTPLNQNVPITAGEVQIVQLVRTATDVLDTLENVVGVIGVLAERAS